MHSASRIRSSLLSRSFGGRWSCIPAALIACLLPCCNEKQEKTSDTTTSPPTKPVETEVTLPTIDLATAVPKDDPATDGWETEVLAENAKKQLKALGKYFFSRGAPNRPDILSHRVDIAVFADNGAHFSAPATFSILFPSHQTRVYERGPNGLRIKSVDYRKGPKRYKE